MEFVTDYRTERYALETTWQDLPADVREHATMCGIDLMTALILGSRSKQFEAGCRLAGQLGLRGDIPVIGDESGYNLLGAAMTMGHGSNAFDIDDGHRQIQGHPGTSFVGGVLAAAIDRDVPWQEYLTTLAVCYELSIRWALAMRDHYSYLHSTGAYGAFGTAAGVGRLLGLSKEQLNNALSVADYHAPMTPVMRAVEYPSMNKDGVPFGAAIGTLAVLETLSGFTGKTHILEIPQYACHLDDLGSTYHIKELYFKPYTCCRWAHQPILACQTLLLRHGFAGADVDSAVIHTFGSAARLSKIRPQSTDEAQYNIAFPVAAALVHDDVGYAQVCEESLRDPAVLAMMDRLSFVVDPDLDRQFPGRRLAWVAITLKDGSVLRSETYEAPGEPDDPALNPDWVIAKFKRVTADFLAPGEQDELIGCMTGRPDMPVRAIVETINRALSGGGRQSR